MTDLNALVSKFDTELTMILRLFVQFISFCTSYISSNVTYIFGLHFGAMLVTIIRLSGLLCICRGIYPLGESILEEEGKVIGSVHLTGWKVRTFEKLPGLCYLYPW